MQEEFVDRRRWLTRGEFLDYIGLTNLIPGPNSTEVAIHLGLRRGGSLGLVAAGVAFILPAALLVTAAAWIYVRVGRLPEVRGVLDGVTPVVIVIIAQAIWKLARSAVRSALLAVVAVAAVVASAVGVHELVVLPAAAVVVVLARRTRADTAPAAAAPALAPAGLMASASPLAGAAAVGLWPLFTTFVKMGAVLFGSGYVLVAFLRADFVDRLHWISERQLLDAIAVGQVTPGPLFTTATFIGYLVGRGWGALLATVGIFLPAFVFVALSGAYLPRLRQSPTARAAIDGVNVGALALMAVVAWQLARGVLVTPAAVALAAVSALVLFRYRINPTWLMLGGGVVGMLARAGRV